MISTADQCRDMGLTVGDTIVGMEVDQKYRWRESELTLIFLGLQVAVFSGRSRSWDAPRWRSNGESADWTLDCREWKKV